MQLKSDASYLDRVTRKLDREKEKSLPDRYKDLPRTLSISTENRSNI